MTLPGRFPPPWRMGFTAGLSRKIAVNGDSGPSCGAPSVLSNIVLDELDWELERGHRFVRYADDSNIFVRSAPAGERVMASIRHFLERRMWLKANEEKSGMRQPHQVRVPLSMPGRPRRVGKQPSCYLADYCAAGAWRGAWKKRPELQAHCRIAIQGDCGFPVGEETVMTESPSPLKMLLSRHTRRRDFIAGLGSAAAWPVEAQAQAQRATSLCAILA
jgi:hypothetical protein